MGTKRPSKVVASGRAAPRVAQGADKRPPVVAVGCASGGLKALKALFGALPDNPHAAFVIVTEPGTGDPGDLARMLSARTTMPVREVRRMCRIRPGHIYIIPPGRRTVAAAGQIGSQPDDDARDHRMPVDRFFGALADQLQDGVAVVLSGTGTDGAVGVRAVKEAGGLILVQDPDEAECGAMPRTAVATGCADAVLPVAELAARLVELVGSRPRVAPGDQGDRDAALRRILGFLHARTGHDFSHYKQATILRRLARRMQINGLERIEDYHALLRDNAGEPQALFADFLISVTAFFRDPEAFSALAEAAMSRLLAAPADGGPLRFWVAGCATGEEAYSLAILIVEAAERRGVRPEVQIFATDIDAGALELAREGLYPVAIEADVGADRLSRFFTREGGRYRVRAQLRDLVVFARHSLLSDPPFSRLDLVSCRNLLIYLDREVQDRMLTTLHNALKPGGVLFLGAAESADGVPDLFEPLDRRHRIYRARSRASALPASDPRPVPVLTTTPRAPPETAALHGEALEQLAPPSVLVDEALHVLHLSETAGRYMTIGAGTLSRTITQLIRPELRPELARGLTRAFETGASSLSPPVPVRVGGQSRRVMLNVRPLGRDGAVAEALVMFIDGGLADPQPGRPQANPRDADEATLAHLREDLARAQEQLRLSRAGHDLTNQELHSINEAYRAASQALEASRHEVQSMAEELHSLNVELKARADDLSQVDADFRNLTAAMEGGTLFLDADLRIRLFTPGVAEHFNITAGDIGRPITDFTHRLAYDDLADDAHRVLRDLTPVDREVMSVGGNWLRVHMRPYRTPDDRTDGVVASFADVSGAHRAGAARREAEVRLGALVDATSSVFFRVSPDWSDLRELRGNGLVADKAEPGVTWLDSCVDAADRPRGREAIAEAIRTGGRFELEHRVTRPDGRPARVVSVAVPIRDDDGGIVEWLGVASDVNAPRQAQADLAQVRRSEVISRLAGGISHDFNNLLTVITASLELAGLRLQDEAARPLIDRASRAADLCTSVNRRLVSLAGRRVVAPERLVLNSRVAELGKLLEQALGERITVVADLASDLWPTNVDPGEVDNALLNLALDARDAMPEGGTLTFVTRNVALDARRAGAIPGARPGDFVRVMVADSGAGMSPGARGRVTEAFLCSEGDRASNGDGLYGVLAFLRERNGFLDLDSAPGQGTRISLYLPRAVAGSAEEPDEKDDGSALPRGRGERILVVEDEPAVRAAMHQRLETLGYGVVEASTAAAGIALLQSDSDIRLVFTDVALPGGMNGLDLARWVRNERPETAVLLVSGYAAVAGLTEDSALLGSVKLIAKPYGLSQLARSVRDALG